MGEGESYPDGFPVDSPALAGFSFHVSPKPRTLAIVGSHPATRDLAPYDDPEVEIWLFNEAPMKESVYRRWDACLQIHGPEVYKNPNNWVNMGYWDWLRERRGKPIYMQEADPEIPDSVRYPLEEVLELAPYRYLRSSPAMALALAIYLGYEHIQLYGSELSSNTEYAYQAVNYAFWIGFAHGRGIKLELKCWESEFNQKIYGYEGELQLGKEYFEGRIAENEPILKTNRKALGRLKEQIGEAMLKNEHGKVAMLAVNAENAALAAGELEGIVSEAQRYLAKEGMISRQEFERVAAQAQKDGIDVREKKDHEGGKVEYVWNAWRQSGQLAALNQLREFLNKKLELAEECGRKSGAYNENIRCMNEYDSRLTAAGGVRALGRVDEVEKVRK